MSAVTEPREIRLGLVMNGGVSLAVWIGGVTLEIDRLRLASLANETPSAATLDGTGAAYQRLLKILHQKVVVDVISGASAGGINGILLAAAIANGRSLPNLRETWIGVGDFRSLLRPASEPNPPSLLQGDKVVLAEMHSVLDALYANSQPCPQEYVYLYVSATDLRGYTRQFHDSTNRIFEEREHRRMLRFALGPPARIADQQDLSQELVFPWDEAIDLRGSTSARLLAEAARSTSSFPVAFEPHPARFEGDDGGPQQHWLVDGGMLDNQPFNPVLDRISVLPGGGQIKRVIAFIVPYVNEPGSFLEQESPPTAKELSGASGSLPRDLPKLQGLDRVVSQGIVQARAEEDRRRAWNPSRSENFAEVAETLLHLYRETRLESSYLLFAAWASPGFRPGDGVHGQDPSHGPQLALSRRRARTPEASDPTGVPWVPGDRLWADDPTWSWGYAVAERAAGWALLFLRDALADELAKEPAGGVNVERVDAIVEARQIAADLILDVRGCKERLARQFRALPEVRASIDRQQAELDRPVDRRRDLRPTAEELRAWALQAYADGSVQTDLARHREAFVALDAAIAEVNIDPAAAPALPDVQNLLDLEVIRNATSIESSEVPFPFDFLFMSAGVKNSLGHGAKTPAEKLAGIKAGHFAGFLKRSWRANDWLWGRMDGVEHLLRALLDADLVAGLADDTIEELAAFAFPEGQAGELLAGIYHETAVEAARGDFVATLQEAREAFRSADPTPEMLAQGAFPDQDAEVQYEAARRKVDHCRQALAARIQLEILTDDTNELERIATTVDEDVRAGASKLTRGVYWKGKFDAARDRLELKQRWQLFTQLDIAKEEPKDEASSRLVMDIGAQAAAVAAALVAGDRSGLPLAARGSLATLRGTTLSVSTVVRLLARQPLIGAALIALLVALFVWGLTTGGVLLGIVVPGLALAIVVGAIVLLSTAVGMLERPLGSVGAVIGFAILLGIPLAVALLAGQPGWGKVADWLDTHANERVVDIVVVLAWIAVACALGRLVLELPRRWRPDWIRRPLDTYRFVIVAGALILLGGFLAERWIGTGTTEHWRAAADEHKGIIFLGSLLLVVFLAGVLVEIVYPWFARRSVQKSPTSA